MQQSHVIINHRRLEKSEGATSKPHSAKKRQFHHALAAEVEQMHTENPTEYWGFWRRYRKPHQNNNHIDIDTFTRHYKKMSKPNVNHNFDYEYMNKISSFIDKCSSENVLCHNQYIDDMMNAPISEDELSYVLRKAKNGKAGGADAIPTEFYKYSTPNLNKAILALFNYVFENGDYPEIWSHGIISPIYKAGEMHCPENYRKITLLSSLGKIFDSVLNNRLCFCKEAFRLNNPWQNGFKQGSRTTDNLFIFNAILDKYKALKRPLYVCYVDFKSAFDYINRHALLFKLMTQGFTGKIFTIMRNLFSKAKSMVKWNSEVGELFNNVCGVLQGGTISPTLFNAYVDDMQSFFNEEPSIKIGGQTINHLLQADDLILVSETSVGLQKLLDKLTKYCRRWHLILNVQKTKTMIFNPKFRVTEAVKTFTFNGDSIEECAKYKYLGVIFSSQGHRFKENISHLKAKSIQAIITSKTSVHGAVGNELPTQLFFKIFNHQVRPILEYASEIWYQEKPIEDLERVQLKYLKNVLSVRQSTPDLAVYGETGQFPLHLRQQDQLVKYWLRIMSMPSDHVLKSIYDELIIFAEKGHNNFARKIIALLSQYGLDYSEVHGTLENDLKSFEQNFREKRYSHYLETWYQNQWNFPKLDIYRQMKSDFRVEPHILYVRNKKHQQALSRLRVSSHNLLIEQGRHSRPVVPRNERLCKFCPLNEIDDEIHFLMTCTFHSDERNALFKITYPLLGVKDYSEKRTNFKIIMSSKEPKVLQSLAKFIYISFKKRE